MEALGLGTSINHSVRLCVLQSMEASGLEMKLKHKLRKSAGADGGGEQYQPAQLERHQHKRRKLEQQQAQGGKVRREVGWKV